MALCKHDDVIKWKHFPRYLPFVRGIHRSPVNSPHKGQWHGTLLFPLICTRINGWVNNGEVGDLRRHRAHYDVTVMEGDRRNFLTKVLWRGMRCHIMMSSWFCHPHPNVSHQTSNCGPITGSTLSFIVFSTVGLYLHLPSKKCVCWIFRAVVLIDYTGYARYCFHTGQ